MSGVPCPECGATLPGRSTTVRCRCGAISRVTKNGDVGFQVDTWPDRSRPSYIVEKGVMKHAKRPGR